MLLIVHQPPSLPHTHPSSTENNNLTTGSSIPSLSELLVDVDYILLDWKLGAFFPI
jgi:hypothetical protein